MTENPLSIKVKNGSAKIVISKSLLKKALFDVFCSIGKSNYYKLSKTVIEIIRVNKEDEVVIFELVFNPLFKAIHNLMKRKGVNFHNYVHMKGVETHLSRQIEDIGIEIDENFFLKATEAEFFCSAKQIIYNLLLELDIEESISKNIICNLEYEYISSLAKFWDEKKEIYDPILKKFRENPFYQNYLAESSKFKYYTNLLDLYFEPSIADKKLILKDLYINQHFKVFKECVSESFIIKKNYDDRDGFIDVNEQMDIHYFTENYFLKSNPWKEYYNESNILLLLGQPGQGKTSFCIKTIHSLLNTHDFNRNLYYVPLRKLRDAKKFIARPMNAIHDYFEKKRIVFKEDSSLLILDGLDELFLSSGLYNSHIRELFRFLERIIDTSIKLKIIVTSRYNYIDLKDISTKKVFVIQLKELNLSQQKELLAKYREKHPESNLTIEKLLEINDNNNKQYDSIRELIRQPILLFIVAKANLKIDLKYNRAIIYDKLFSALVGRNWSVEGRLERFGHINETKLKNFLSFLAFKIYQSPFDCITRKEIMDLPETKKFIEQSKLDNENLDSALKDLLISFYFRNTENNGGNLKNATAEYAIEFMHKSLQDYLTTEYIYKEISNNFTDISKISEEYILSTPENALRLLWEMFSKKQMTIEIKQYLAECIENDSDDRNKQVLKNRLREFLKVMLIKQFLYFHDSEKREEEYPFRKAISTFEGYWYILSRVNDYDNFITPEIKNLFTEMLELCKDRVLSYFNLSHQELDSCNLTQLEIYDANFHKANLMDTVLCNSWLKNPDFTESKLSQADFTNSVIINGDFTNSNLTRTIFKGTVLINCVFHGANLKRTDFRGAYIRNSSFRYSNVQWIITDKYTNLEDVEGLGLS